MKKILLIAVILTFTAGLAHAQFAAGTKYLGGTVGYYKDMTDYGDDFDFGSSTITVAPAFGYFVIDNFMLAARLGYIKTSMNEGDDPDATTAFAVGAKYFMNYLYAGAAYRSSTTGDADAIASLVFEGGYLYPITDYFFLDLGVDYFMGTGDNEMKGLQAGFGFATFF